jgi:hypothetical protein
MLGWQRCPTFLASKGQTIAVSSLISASDAHNDALTDYFYDNTADAASGQLVFNGMMEPPNTSFAVPQADISDGLALT